MQYDSRSVAAFPECDPVEPCEVRTESSDCNLNIIVNISRWVRCKPGNDYLAFSADND